METMDAVEAGEGGSGRSSFCSSTPSDRGEFLSAVAGSGYSWSVDISRLGIDTNKLIFQLPSDASRIRSRKKSAGRNPTSLCVNRVFSVLNYDGGVCENTG